jgi:hypothetical protein
LLLTLFTIALHQLSLRNCRRNALQRLCQCANLLLRIRPLALKVCRRQVKVALRLTLLRRTHTLQGTRTGKLLLLALGSQVRLLIGNAQLHTRVGTVEAPRLPSDVGQHLLLLLCETAGNRGKLPLTREIALRRLLRLSEAGRQRLRLLRGDTLHCIADSAPRDLSLPRAAKRNPPGVKIA